jgi:S1-C subfamily serine protease
MKKIVALCLGSAVGGALLVEGWRLASSERPLVAQQPLPSTTTVRPVPPRPADENGLMPDEWVNVTVYEKVNRSVVNINTKLRGETFFFFENSSEGAGSGSVIDNRGHILTNYHVVDGAREIQVALFDGNSYEGRLVGKDESNDVAVIKIEAPPESLLPVTWGESTHLRVGQRVFAIGNPFGFERTLSTGIISSLNRSLPTRNHRTIKAIIQIDAAINPGNSGGPLLDSHGRLIGMNTAIASPTGQSAGVGFAIPVAAIARIVPQLIERGHVIRPEAGITRVLETERGLLIVSMVPGGPAEQAGLRPLKITKQRHKQGPFTYETRTIDRNAADLITAVDGEKVLNANDFLALVEAKEPGHEIMITVLREGREVKVPLRLVAGES